MFNDEWENLDHKPINSLEVAAIVDRLKAKYNTENPVSEEIEAVE
jgi:hypothetical protein